jgi:hypothetical protein
MMKKVLRLKLLFLISLCIVIPSLTMAQAKYVGSEKCKSCRKAIDETWKDTLHGKSQQALTPTNDTVVVGWKGTVKLNAGKIPEVTVKRNETPGGEGEKFEDL